MATFYTLLWAFSVLLLNCDAFTKEQDVVQLRDAGLKLATDNNLKDSLMYFRSAVRVDPTCSFCWNDLGVTEMRLGEYENAKRHFWRALSVDPYNEVANENLAELADKLNDYSMKPPPPAAAVTTSPESIRRVSVSALVGVNPYDIEKMGPMIVTGATKDWNMYALRPRTLTKKYGQTIIEYYPHDMKTSTCKPILAELGEAISQVYEPSRVLAHVDMSERETYVHWNLSPQLWNEFLNETCGDCKSFPRHFLSDSDWDCFGSRHDLMSEFFIATHWKMLTIGNTGSGMFVHKDTLKFSSFQVQAFGRKRWFICKDPPFDKAGVMNTFTADPSSLPGCIDGIVNPGEVLVYPTDYWHQTLNLDTPTVSLSGSLVTRDNYIDAEKELNRECDGKWRIFSGNAHVDMCEMLHSQCFRSWKKRFGGTDDDWLVRSQGQGSNGGDEFADL